MRYLPHTADDRLSMLKEIGVGSVNDLFADVPAAMLLTNPVDLPKHQGEQEVMECIQELAERNLSADRVPSFLGAGTYHHYIPATVDHLIQRSEFLTSYTPYQPEVSQGTLQYLFEFQTQVALLTGMEIANASMYDGATACAEAVMMANRITKRKKAILSGGLHPHYRDVTLTHIQYTGAEISVAPFDLGGVQSLLGLIDQHTACVVVQNPDVFGHVNDLSSVSKACHAVGALLIVVVTEILSLGALKSPGDMGADIVAAEGQSLGNGLNFGGPHLGLLSCRSKFVRQMPGRIVGQTYDAQGRRGFVLTLSTREQHIRRGKATSNICTNSGLCALAFTIHLSLLGDEGLKKLAEINHKRAVMLAERINKISQLNVVNDTFFNEFTVALPRPASEMVSRLAKERVLVGVPVSRLFPKTREMENQLLVAVTEMCSEQDIDTLVSVLERYVHE